MAVRHEPLLRERNFGDIRGTSYADLGFDMFAPDYAPPNGETWEVFHARVDRAWEVVRAAVGPDAGHLAEGSAVWIVSEELKQADLVGCYPVEPDNHSHERRGRGST